MPLPSQLMRRAIRWCALASATVVAVLVVLPSGAEASSGPIALSSYNNADPPLVAYDPGTGYTYVAWTSAAENNGVYFCAVAPGTQSCADGGPIELTDSQFSNSDDLFLGDLNVLPNGDVVVLGATEDSGSVAWVSAAGGAGFAASGQGLENSGSPVSPVEDYYTPGDSTVLGDGDIGLLDSYGNYFGDVPIAGPEAPPAALAASNANGEYANGPSDTADAPSIGAEATPGAVSGYDTVVTVGVNNNSSQGTPGACPNYYATGYTVRVGIVNGTSDQPGTLNDETPDASLLACQADDPVVVSGGGAGIGVVEQEGSDVSGLGDISDIDFQKFTATGSGGSFGASKQLANVTANSINGVNEIDATEDSGDGIYALWDDEQGYVIDYSPNSGSTWEGPIITSVNGSDANMAAVGNGYAEVAYMANPSGGGDQVFLQEVNGVPPTPVTVTTKQTSGSKSGASISIPAGTIGETDQATLRGAHIGEEGGTIVYDLYSNASCTKLAASGGSHTFIDGRVPASAPITKGLAPGTYYWQARFGGDPTNDAAKSTCDATKLTVTQPAITGSTGTVAHGKLKLSVTTFIGATVTLKLTGKNGHKSVKLGTGSFSSPGPGTGTLKLKLSKKGKKLLQAHHDKLTATVALTTKTAHGTFTAKRTLKIRK